MTEPITSQSLATESEHVVVRGTGASFLQHVQVGKYRFDVDEPVSVGGLDQSIRIEMFGDLHEYGALGRVVTKSEALAAL